MDGNFTFENVGDKKLTVSDSQASAVKNQLEMKVTYDMDEKPDIEEIELIFPAGSEETDFAERQNLDEIEFKVDDWSVVKLSKEKYLDLKKRRKEKSADIAPHRWYMYIDETDSESFYHCRLLPSMVWEMKDHIIVDLDMENVVTTAKEGACTVQFLVTDYDGDARKGALEIVKEQNHSVRILDFYPESGSAWEGEQVRLNWFAENAEKLVLYSDGKEKELNKSQTSEMVMVTKSAKYVLKAFNGDQQDSRETTIQVTPLFLGKFAVNYKDEKLIWDVHCGKNIKINNVPTQFASGSAELKNYTEGKAIVLTAEGKNTSVESALYYGTKEQSTDVVHFQKTITFYKNFQILDVSWELYELQTENVAKSVRIVYQDRERNELYDIKGGENLGTTGSWQQILTGTEPSRAGENILVTMYVEPFRDETAKDYTITI